MVLTLHSIILLSIQLSNPQYLCGLNTTNWFESRTIKNIRTETRETSIHNILKGVRFVHVGTTYFCYYFSSIS